MQSAYNMYSEDSMFFLQKRIVQWRIQNFRKDDTISLLKQKCQFHILKYNLLISQLIILLSEHNTMAQLSINTPLIDYI